MDANITAQPPDANREHKDSVFTMLFGNEAVLIELTNAIFGTRYGADTAVLITTLKNVLSRGWLNDLSYVLDDRLIVLVEHQSTIDDAMPYRMLQYIAATYDRLYDINIQYRQNIFPLKRPKFVVLYNGAAEMKEDVKIMRLSDMFAPYAPKEKAADTGLIDLELTVTMYNIKDGRNADIVKRCATLRGYGIFTDMIRENHRQEMSPEASIRKAVEDCIDQNVLKTFLEKHKKEVIGMLLTEWDWDVALAVRKEEGVEEGVEKGKGEEKVDTARRLLALGMDVNTISRATELPVDTILKL